MKLTFMDFCAGIGAGRLGLQNSGLKCLGFSEINKEAERTYREFYGNEEKNFGDLMKINCDDLPNFDLMIAGFPCQTFQGSLKIGQIGMQRKGGYGGRESAKMLQFKINPVFLFNE